MKCGVHILFVMVAATFFITAAVAGGSVAQWSDDKIAYADKLIRPYVEQSIAGELPDAPTISFAIGVDGQMFYSGGFGGIAPGVTADERTLYQVGSITKQFTAATILRLIEQGVAARKTRLPLQLDTSVSQFFDDTPGWMIEGSSGITVFNLLSMTSSLPNFTRRPPKMTDPWGAIAAPDLLGAIKRLKVSGFPESFEYSNTSYFLLAEIIEEMDFSGVKRTYRDVVKSELIARAGLVDTGFVGDVFNAATIAPPTYKKRPAFTMPDWLKGSGDMVSSASDLFAWNTALMGGKVIGAGMLAKMFSDAARVDVWTYYGMGWFVTHHDGFDIYSHSGAVPGFTSFNLIARQGNGHWASVSLLTNADGVQRLDEVAARLAELALN